MNTVSIAPTSSLRRLPLVSWLLANAGVPLGWCLAVAMLVPWVVVVGYETRGAEHQARLLEGESEA